jgi:hypothetical protein
VRRGIALVGHFPWKSLPLARRLEQDGFEVSWIVRWPSESSWLAANGVPASRVLEAWHVDTVTGEELQALSRELAELEAPGLPFMHDLVQMDRYARREGHEQQLRYLAYLNRAVTAFLRERGVRIVSTRQDTVLQLLVFHLARRLGIVAVAPDKVRYPAERWGFFPGPHQAGLLPLRPVGPEDRDAARTFVRAFRGAGQAPPPQWGALGHVVRALPAQLAFFRQWVGWSRADRGIRNNRWTVPDLARMYVRRRWNLLRTHAAASAFDAPRADRPFFLYTLHIQPESSVDVLGSWFSDQRTVISHISRATPATHDLYVKVHWADVGNHAPGWYDELRAIPGVRVIGPDASTRDLLLRADLTFTVSGTIGYEAGLLGRPAVVFAPMFFNGLPTVHPCESPPELPVLVSRLLADPGAGEDEEEAVVEFVAGVHAASFPGQHNRLVEALSPADLDAVADAYARLWAHLEGSAPSAPARGVPAAARAGAA